MWNSASEWHETGSWAGPRRRGDDATILWFNEQTARGAVVSDDGRVRNFGRRELPATIGDRELTGIAMRRVHWASFRFGEQGSEAPTGTVGVGGGDRPPAQASLSLPAGDFRLTPPASGVAWRTASSDEPTSGSPDRDGGATQSQSGRGPGGDGSPALPGNGAGVYE